MTINYARPKSYKKEERFLIYLYAFMWIQNKPGFNIQWSVQNVVQQWDDGSRSSGSSGSNVFIALYFL